MAVTVTPIDKSTEVSFTGFTKPAGSDIEQGSPIGLLLALTYPEAVAGTGALEVTLISQS